MNNKTASEAIPAIWEGARKQQQEFGRIVQLSWLKYDAPPLSSKAEKSRLKKR